MPLAENGTNSTYTAPSPQTSSLTSTSSASGLADYILAGLQQLTGSSSTLSSSNLSSSIPEGTSSLTTLSRPSPSSVHDIPTVSSSTASASSNGPLTITTERLRTHTGSENSTASHVTASAALRTVLSSTSAKRLGSSNGTTTRNVAAAAYACEASQKAWREWYNAPDTDLSSTYSTSSWSVTVGTADIYTTSEGIPVAHGSLTPTGVTWFRNSTLEAVPATGLQAQITKPSPTCHVPADICTSLYESYMDSLGLTLFVGTIPASGTNSPVCATPLVSLDSNGDGTSTIGPPCSFWGGPVQLYYWNTWQPTPMSSGFAPAPTNVSVESVTVLGNKTLTYPSVYLRIGQLTAWSEAMVWTFSDTTSATASEIEEQMGSAYYDIFFPLHPTEVSSLRYSAYNYADFVSSITASGWYNLDLISYQSGQPYVGTPHAIDYQHITRPSPEEYFLNPNAPPNCAIDGVDPMCGTIFEADYRPQLSIPSQLIALDAAWSDCLPYIGGIYDPPTALQAATTIALPTSPSGRTSDAKTTTAEEGSSLTAPTPEATSTAVIASPTPAASTNVAPPSNGDGQGTQGISNPDPDPSSATSAAEETTAGTSRGRSSSGVDEPSVLSTDTADDSGGNTGDSEAGRTETTEVVSTNDPSPPTMPASEKQDPSAATPVATVAASDAQETTDFDDSSIQQTVTSANPAEAPRGGSGDLSPTSSPDIATPPSEQSGATAEAPTAQTINALSILSAAEATYTDAATRKTAARVTALTAEESEETAQLRNSVAEIKVDGSTITAVQAASTSIAILADATLSIDGSGISLGDTKVSLASEGLVVVEASGTGTVAFAAGLETASADGESLLTFEAGGSTITASLAEGSAVDLNGATTLSRDGSAIHVDGATLRLVSQGVEVAEGKGTTTVQLPGGTDSPDAGAILIPSGTATITASAVGSTAVALGDGKTLFQGSPASTIGNEILSLGPSGLVIQGPASTNTLALHSLSTTFPGPASTGSLPRQQEIKATITAADTTLTVSADPQDPANVVIKGMTLSPSGSALTLEGGETISLAPSGLLLLAGDGGNSRGYTSTVSLDTVGKGEILLTAGSSTFTAYIDTQDPAALIIDGTTLSPGGPAHTIAGETFSAAPSGVVVVIDEDSSRSSTTLLLPTAAATAAVETVVTAAGAGTFTVFQDPGNSAGLVVEGVTLSQGGSAYTLADHKAAISLAGSSDLVVIDLDGSRSSTILLTIAPVKTVVTASGDRTFTVFQAPGNPAGVVVDGLTLLPGGVGVTVDGEVVSVGRGGGLVVGGALGTGTGMERGGAGITGASGGSGGVDGSGVGESDGSESGDLGTSTSSAESEGRSAGVTGAGGGSGGVDGSGAGESGVGESDGR
ncbi:hypothetical protein B0A50_08321 [Salinomyces thailandicus]|uniref:Uncharacterized protein n=1 Tax=Salinomyces thailandicus TaxID=706561 RepID=A0A4V5N4P4_9PEZI|nr:hypothetical protein B0A50_08321 [Salinomyces thailandica]